MAGIDAWLDAPTGNAWLGDKARPASVGAIIADKPTSIVVRRLDPLTTLSAQTVRLDTLAGPQEDGADNLLYVAGTQRVLVTGYRNHPTVADTDLRLGDEFSADAVYYRVVMVQPSFADRLLAVAEAQARP